MIILIVIFILLLIRILISVAFLTLMERKFLGYIQLRKGPNKLGFGGLMQPFRDAIKLLIKEIYFISKLNYLIYLLSPMFRLILIIIIWLIYPLYTNFLTLNLSFLYLICCFRLGVYRFLISGWSSNSSYSMLGSIRSLAQSISYEVRLSIIIIIPLILINELDLRNLILDQINYHYWFLIWPLRNFFFLRILAELNRTPFDFSEGESELVSGFNVEYIRSGFILIFLSEYSRIIFLRFIYMIFYGSGFYDLFFYVKIISIVFLVIWLRGSFPRFRYDLLIYLCWLIILPFSLNYLIYIIFFKILVYKKR